MSKKFVVYYIPTKTFSNSTQGLLNFSNTNVDSDTIYGSHISSVFSGLKRLICYWKFNKNKAGKSIVCKWDNYKE